LRPHSGAWEEDLFVLSSHSLGHESITYPFTVVPYWIVKQFLTFLIQSLHPCFADTCREYLKPDGTVGVRSTRGWYERAENNGWRPISERILVEEDPITTMTKMKRMPLFHFSPGVRRCVLFISREEMSTDCID